MCGEALIQHPPPTVLWSLLELWTVCVPEIFYSLVDELHTVWLPHFKRTVQWLLEHLQSHGVIVTVNFRFFFTP